MKLIRNCNNCWALVDEVCQDVQSMLAGIKISAPIAQERNGCEYHIFPPMGELKKRKLKKARSIRIIRSL